MDQSQVGQLESALPEVGSLIGGPIGGMIGSALEAVSGLFGPSVHHTTTGMTYDQASILLLDQELTINSLYEHIYGKPLDGSIPPRKGNAAEWSYESGLVARYLKNPSLQSPDPKNWDRLKGDGSIDAAIQVQKSVMSQLQTMASNPVSTSAPANAVGGALASVTSNPMMLLLVIVAAILLLRN